MILADRNWRLAVNRLILCAILPGMHHICEISMQKWTQSMQIGCYRSRCQVIFGISEWFPNGCDFRWMYGVTINHYFFVQTFNNRRWFINYSVRNKIRKIWLMFFLLLPNQNLNCLPLFRLPDFVIRSINNENHHNRRIKINCIYSMGCGCFYSNLHFLFVFTFIIIFNIVFSGTFIFFNCDWR